MGTTFDATSTNTFQFSNLNISSNGNHLPISANTPNFTVCGAQQPNCNIRNRVFISGCRWCNLAVSPALTNSRTNLSYSATFPVVCNANRFRRDEPAISAVNCVTSVGGQGFDTISV